MGKLFGDLKVEVLEEIDPRRVDQRLFVVTSYNASGSYHMVGEAQSTEEFVRQVREQECGGSWGEMVDGARRGDGSGWWVALLIVIAAVIAAVT